MATEKPSTKVRSFILSLDTWAVLAALALALAIRVGLINKVPW